MQYLTIYHCCCCCYGNKGTSVKHTKRFFLFIHSSSVTTLFWSWSGSLRSLSLGQEHWMWGRNSAWIGGQFTTGHHAHTHSQQAAIYCTQSTYCQVFSITTWEETWEPGGNATKTVTWAQDWTVVPGAVKQQNHPQNIDLIFYLLGICHLKLENSKILLGLFWQQPWVRDCQDNGVYDWGHVCS